MLRMTRSYLFRIWYLCERRTCPETSQVYALRNFEISLSPEVWGCMVVLFVTTMTWKSILSRINPVRLSNLIHQTGFLLLHYIKSQNERIQSVAVHCMRFAIRRRSERIPSRTTNPGKAAFEYQSKQLKFSALWWPVNNVSWYPPHSGHEKLTTYEQIPVFSTAYTLYSTCRWTRPMAWRVTLNTLAWEQNQASKWDSYPRSSVTCDGRCSGTRRHAQSLYTTKLRDVVRSEGCSLAKI